MRAEEPAWNELEGMLRRLEDDPAARLDMAEVRRLQYLYERAASGLSSLGGLAGEVELRARLERRAEEEEKLRREAEKGQPDN